MERSLISVFRATNDLEAECVKLMLEADGIEAVIWGQHLQTAVGDLPAGWVSAPQIAVSHDHSDQARQLLAEYQSRRKARLSAPPDSESREEPANATVSGGTGDNMSPAGEPSVDQAALYWDLAVILCVGFVSNFHSALDLYLNNNSDLVMDTKFAISLLIHSCVIIVVLWAYIIRTGQELSRFGMDRPRLWDIPISAALVALFWILRPFLSCFLLLTSDQTEVQWVTASVDSTGMTVIGLADFANAFAEEFAMRGLLLTLLVRLWRSRLWAVIASSACFASYHIYYGLFGMQWVFIMGLYFGISFVILRRLWPVILCHFAFNILQ